MVCIHYRVYKSVVKYDVSHRNPNSERCFKLKIDFWIFAMYIYMLIKYICNVIIIYSHM